MTKIHPAIAEHVMEENERLRGLLRLATDRWESWASEIIHTTPEYESELAEIARIRAALSQQAEPAPAQDDRDVAAVIGFYEGEREPRLLSWNVLPNGEHRLYTRPAQTEQQPLMWVSRVLKGSLVGKLIQVDPNSPPNSALYGEPFAVYAAPIAQTAPQTEQSGLVPEGYAMVPITPTEAQWSGLARDLMMWLDMSDKTAQGLFKHLRMLGVEPPQWLRDEPEMQGAGVPSKGTRVTLIYRAMIEDFLATLSAQGASK